MTKFFCFILFGLVCCSSPKQTGKRVSLARGNVSFILPDSLLIYNKSLLWPGDYALSDYGEDGAFYHNSDSTVTVLVYVKAYPDTLQGRQSWRVIADEKRQRQEFSIKNHGLAVIEKYTADSLSRTVEIDYHIPKRQENNLQSQAKYEKNFTIYGRHRTIEFWFFGPDTPASRERFAFSQASVRVNPIYLQAIAKPHSEYKD